MKNPTRSRLPTTQMNNNKDTKKRPHDGGLSSTEKKSHVTLVTNRVIKRVWCWCGACGKATTKDQNNDCLCCCQRKAGKTSLCDEHKCLSFTWHGAYSRKSLCVCGVMTCGRCHDRKASHSDRCRLSKSVLLIDCSFCGTTKSELYQCPDHTYHTLCVECYNDHIFPNK